MTIENIILALRPLTSRVRIDVTAVKKPNGMIWSKQSLTPKRMEKHIDGDVGRGVCPIKAGDDRTAVAVFDLDSHGGETAFEQMIQHARDVSIIAESYGLKANLFSSSGGRGIHIIFMWDELQDAYTVRQTLAKVLNDGGYKNGTGGVAKNEIEIFPKQDFVPVGGYGSQFILPLHGKSRPLDLDFGALLDKDDIPQWQISQPLEQMEKPVRTITKTTPTGDMKKWADMLMAIDPDCSYEEWLRCGMALHFESEGSIDGLLIWDEWSALGSKYPTYEVLEKKWEGFGRKDNQVTGGSIEAIARIEGYNDDVLDEFEDLTGADLVGSSQSTRQGNDTAGNDRPDAAGTLSARIGDDGNQGRQSVGAQNVGNDDAVLNAHVPEISDGTTANGGFIRFDRTDDGRIKATPENVYLALSRPDYCGWQVRYDTFRDEIMFLRNKAEGWKQFTDPDYMRLRVLLGNKGFQPIGRDLIRDGIALVADNNRFDTAVHWLESLPEWDGVPRIDTFIPKYFGASDDAYTRSVGAYLWTALAGRVLEPGCQANMCPIFVGKQGIRKSTAVAAIVPMNELFCEVSFAEKDDDLARKMRGRLIAEIGELRGLHTKELESIKAFITRTHENWVPKFKEFATTYPRRLVFIGTTNQTEFLADDSGNRRWLPVNVVWAETDAIKADRLQLWAEGRARFKANGVEWQAAERLAGAVHSQYMMTDAWEASVIDYLNREDMDGSNPKDAPWLSSQDILTRALGFDPKHISNREEWRVGKILRNMGFEKVQRKIDGVNKKVWVAPIALRSPSVAPVSGIEATGEDLV